MHRQQEVRIRPQQHTSEEAGGVAHMVVRQLQQHGGGQQAYTGSMRSGIDKSMGHQQKYWFSGSHEVWRAATSSTNADAVV
jgi:hypothetical protein